VARTRGGRAIDNAEKAAEPRKARGGMRREREGKGERERVWRCDTHLRATADRSFISIQVRHSVAVECRGHSRYAERKTFRSATTPGHGRASQGVVAIPSSRSMKSECRRAAINPTLDPPRSPPPRLRDSANRISFGDADLFPVDRRERVLSRLLGGRSFRRNFARA